MDGARFHTRLQMLLILTLMTIVWASDEAELVERSSRRVMGVGIGIFLLAVFGGLSLLICCLGSVTERPKRFYLAGTMVIGIVTLFLFTAQKQSQYVSKEVVLKDYDGKYYTRLCIGVFLLVACLVSLRAVCKHTLLTPLEAQCQDEEVRVKRYMF